jgi:hypothetical protein
MKVSHDKATRPAGRRRRRRDRDRRGTTDDGFESYPDDRELPTDPYAKMREYLPPEVLEEIIAADDKYIAAYRKALREHFGLPPDDNT